jgi:hypothetical protein
MSKRTRLFLSLAASVLVVGLGTGLLASYFGIPGLAQTDSGPAELAYIPADARVVAFIDVQEVMSSELRQKFRELHPNADSDQSIEAQTGINPDTDVNYVVAALLADGTEQRRPLILARGLFKEVQIEGLILEKGGRVENYNGKKLLVLAGDSETAALAFAETGLAVFGQVEAVRKALDTRSGSVNISGNTELMALVKDVTGTSAWAVGRFDAIAGAGQLPANVTDQLPPINLFSASGEINGGVRGVLRAEARDDAAAQNLRQVIQGFVALGRLQSGSNAAIAAVLNSVELSGDGATVALSFSIPAEALDLLAPRLAPREQAALGF